MIFQMDIQALCRNLKIGIGGLSECELVVTKLESNFRDRDKMKMNIKSLSYKKLEHDNDKNERTRTPNDFDDITEDNHDDNDLYVPTEYTDYDYNRSPGPTQTVITQSEYAMETINSDSFTFHGGGGGRR